ncbi:MAG: aspartate-semialdehyde dehydrogenase [Myxococcales bacterium]|nr:aspartate-semialdehyde dehydrogenase [Myxococcales bacterium]
MSLSSPLRVAVVGATGAVGEVLFEILEQRDFPIAELIPLASRRSVGTEITFAGKRLPVQEAKPEAFEGVDLVFFAATGSLSAELAPEAVKRGAVVIDKSNTFRSDPEVPLVVPEINAAALLDHRGIIACPNCTTIGLVMALAPIRRVAGIRSLVVTTLQAASGAGRDGIDELAVQTRALAAGEPLAAPAAFPVPIAHNVIPLCERFTEDDYSTEEHKLVSETRKIFDQPDLPISITAVRVPVPVGHSAAVLIETERPLDVADARAAVAAFPGLELVDDPASNRFPTPRDVAGTDPVLVGRIRKDLNSDRLWLFESSDNLRKGAALNATQVAEALLS